MFRIGLGCPLADLVYTGDFPSRDLALLMQMPQPLSSSQRPVDEIGMLNNLPVKSLMHNGLTIEGYSRAAVQTYWRVPELKVGFDLGGQPWSFMGTPVWFVSHPHLDHLAALPVYVARRRMMKMEPPRIYLPEVAIEPMQRILKLFTRLDRGRMPCELLPIVPGDEVELSREHVVTAAATRHTVPALSYIVWERRRKLKPEYHGLPGEQIRNLRLNGVEVTAEKRVPLVGYLGDSAPQGLDDCPALYEAQVLITELTFSRRVIGRKRFTSLATFTSMI